MAAKDQQVDTATNIKKMLINVKKDSPDRKTKVDYFDTRLVQLESYWSAFSSLHITLLNDMEYVKSNIAQEAGEAYDILKKCYWTESSSWKLSIIFPTIIA